MSAFNHDIFKEAGLEGYPEHMSSCPAVAEVTINLNLVPGWQIVSET